MLKHLHIINLRELKTEPRFNPLIPGGPGTTAG